MHSMFGVCNIRYNILRYVKDWVISIYAIWKVRGKNYIVCEES